MENKFKLVIVIPCFNEAKRFLAKEYSIFISRTPNVLICFVDDGSSDKTLLILKELRKSFPNNIDIVSCKYNVGKGEAVRAGVLYCYDRYEYNYIAYIDADLSVSLQECASMIKYLTKDIVFCFGSRISKIGSLIVRTRSRFLIGRFIATLISRILLLKVYDTQCGCKVLTRKLSIQMFADSFISRWLFDVELFFRMKHLYGNINCLKVMLEIPLNKWIDIGDSKVKYSYFFKVFIDLFLISRKYKILK